MGRLRKGSERELGEDVRNRKERVERNGAGAFRISGDRIFVGQ